MVVAALSLALAGWKIWVPLHAMSKLERAMKEGKLVSIDIEHRHPAWMGRFVDPKTFVPFVDRVTHVYGAQDPDLLESLSAFPEIVHLDLNSMDLDDAGLERIGNLVHLEFLSLSGPGITDRGLRVIGRFTRLRELVVLRRTSITDDGLSHLVNLTNLEYLSLLHTRCQGTGLVHLAGLTSLQSLQLHRNLTSVDSASEPDLEEPTLDDPAKVTAALRSLRPLSKLHTLGLSGVPVDDEGAAEIGAWTQLGVLDLSGTLITDTGFLQLRDLSVLSHLSVDGTQVTDESLWLLFEFFPGLESLSVNCKGISTLSRKRLQWRRPGLGGL